MARLTEFHRQHWCSPFFYASARYCCAPKVVLMAVPPPVEATSPLLNTLVVVLMALPSHVEVTPPSSNSSTLYCGSFHSRPRPWLQAGLSSTADPHPYSQQQLYGCSNVLAFTCEATWRLFFESRPRQSNYTLIAWCGLPWPRCSFFKSIHHAVLHPPASDYIADELTVVEHIAMSVGLFRYVDLNIIWSSLRIIL
jgi:hypothetical protein